MPLYFTSIILCFENYKVQIAYGSLSTLASIGSIALSKSLTLKSVILVPNLSYNFLFISKFWEIIYQIMA